MKQFVEASAGTRKTTRLVEAALDVLLFDPSSDARPEHILAITFTEKAAAEMRMRLSDALRALLRGELVKEWNATVEEIACKRGIPADKICDKARQVSRELDRAFIGTIHSLCLRILRLFPREAGVPPTVEAELAPIFDAEFDDAWDKWTSEQFLREDPDWIGILERVRPSTLRQIARALADFRVPEEFLHEPDRDSEWRQNARTFLQNLASNFPSIGRRAAIPGRYRHSAYSDAVAHAAKRGFLPPEVARRVHTARKVSTDGPPPGIDEQDRKLIKDLDRLDQPLVTAIVRHVAPFVLKLRRDLLASGRITFDGMLALARRVLRNRNARARLKRMFRRIFVDEFQDTDPIQYEIVLALAERDDDFASDWEHICVDPQRLFVVGDPKQSIYAFRGADLEAYTAVKRRLLDCGLEFLRPRENWRSCPHIIEEVNRVFEGIFPSKETPLQAAHVPLVAAPMPDRPSCRPPCVRYIQIETDAIGSDRIEAEARWIAREILRAKEEERRDFRDFAILLRKLTEAHEFMDVLRRAGIPFVVEGDKFFYQQPEVLDLFNLLRAAADPLDEIALVAVLRSPLGGLTDAEIYRLREENRLSYLHHEDPPIFRFLHELHHLSGRVAPPDLIRKVFEASPILAVARSDYRGDAALANLWKLYALATQMTALPDTSLKSFLSHLRRAIAEYEEEGEDPLSDEASDVVRIMSIHRAKGLDFPIVFVPLAFSGSKSGSDGTTVHVRWTTGDVAIESEDVHDLATLSARRRNAEVQRAETQRLLYVAMTRAKERLIICGASPTRGGGQHPFSNILGALVSWEPAQVPDPLPPFQTDRAPEPDLENLRARHQRLANLAREAHQPALIAARRAHEDSAATREALDYIPDEALRIGLDVHTALEHLDFAHPALPEGIHPEARAMLQRFLESDAFAHLRTRRIVAREYPVLVSDGGRVIRGRIDLIYEDDDGAIVIADYKTDKEGDLARKYGPTMDIYRHALARAFPNRTIRAVLVSVPTGTVLALG
jgi:ATP-dependent helicase/nuclease subunit A